MSRCVCGSVGVCVFVSARARARKENVVSARRELEKERATTYLCMLGMCREWFVIGRCYPLSDECDWTAKKAYGFLG